MSCLPLENGEPDPRNYAQELEKYLSALSLESENEQVVSEIGVLQSIYGEDFIRMWRLPSDGQKENSDANHQMIRYEVHLDLIPPHDNTDTRLKILASLPRTYPSSTPPQLQLLSRFIGPFRIDPGLFGSVLRTYISSSGVEWLPKTLCVFDGLEHVRQVCTDWYVKRIDDGKLQDMQREEGKEATSANRLKEGISYEEENATEIQDLLPKDIKIFEAEPIVDRKSIFVGRAARITHPSQVPIILSHLMANKRIARAAHPIINAWRCRVDGRLHQDNDDDGESAAGSRLAHLLQMLDLENVLVVVTRYWGGTLLGADRFKHINRAARDALDTGGLLNTTEDSKPEKRSKKRGRD